MPRKPRVHYSHAIYHVMNQGNFGQNIFFDEHDYRYFYKLMKKVTQKYNCKIHAFCLMTNHVHLLIEISYIPLKKIMQTIGSGYSTYINKKLDRHGHVFRGRYLDKIVEDDGYLLELLYYIHMNPYRAGIVTDLENYPWSSHHCYTKTLELDWLTTALFEKILHQISDEANSYDDFIINRQKYSDEPKYCRFDSSGFLTIAGNMSVGISLQNDLDLRFMSLQEIIDVICGYFNFSYATLTMASKCESCTFARTLTVYYAHYHAQYDLKEIAGMLGFSPDTLSKTLHRQFVSLRKKQKLECEIKNLNRIFLDLCFVRKRAIKFDE